MEQAIFSNISKKGKGNREQGKSRKGGEPGGWENKLSQQRPDLSEDMYYLKIC